MDKKDSTLFGNQDQELLLKAFALYISKITQKSINIVSGMIRMIIHDVVEEKKVMTSQNFDENKREEILIETIDEFFKRAKIGSVHRYEIKTGCLNIYDKWKNIRNKFLEKRDINIKELLGDESSNLVGYEDQEVLLSAFSHYIHRIAGNDIEAVAKMIRICMLEVTIPKKVNFKEVRFLDSETREELIKDGIEEYIKKTNIDEKTAVLVRADCIKVYERWKEIRRVEPHREEVFFDELIV